MGFGGRCFKYDGNKGQQLRRSQGRKGSITPTIKSRRGDDNGWGVQNADKTTSLCCTDMETFWPGINAHKLTVYISVVWLIYQ